MGKILIAVIMVAAVFICSCSDKKVDNPSPEKIERPKITSEFAEAQITELEKGLDVQHDEIKGVTFYTCPIYFGLKVCVAPYVSVADDDYAVEMFCHVVYSGKDRIDFDTLHVTTAGEIKTFYFNDVYRMYHAGYYGDEYNGVMLANLYFTLKKVIDSGSASIRLEGIGFAERDLSSKEIEHMRKVFAIYELLNGVKVEQ